MMIPEPVSDCDWVPPNGDPTCPVTSTVTTLGAMVAAAASGEPLVSDELIDRVSRAVVPLTTGVVSSSSSWATPPPTPPPTTSARASKVAVPALRGRAAGGDATGGAGGGG